MSPRPSLEYTLDRIDNNGNYELSNCKWATRKEQARNTRTNTIKDLQEANEIRNKYKTGNYTQELLATEYNCSSITISQITTNKIWN